MAETWMHTLAGEPVMLLADRALYWPSRNRLLIADLHLGKGHVFRTAGVPVPQGGTHRDLTRLERLLTTSGAGSLWILGDFLHGVRSARTDAAWQAFRHAHPRLQVGVIAGNHDRALSAEAAGVELVREGTLDGPFAFGHHPRHHPTRHWICGHIHPVVRIPDLGRWPLFWLQPGLTVLPAFSAFTGGHVIPWNEARGGFACNGHALAPL